MSRVRKVAGSTSICISWALTALALLTGAGWIPAPASTLRSPGSRSFISPPGNDTDIRGPDERQGTLLVSE